MPFPQRPEHGRIVWVEIADPQSRNPKRRPAVILNRTADIAQDTLLEVVGITTRLPRPLPPDHVLLPWARGKHPRTGLSAPCAAVCTWLAVVEPSRVLECAGLVPSKQLEQILIRVAAARGETSPSPEESAESP